MNKKLIALAVAAAFAAPAAMAQVTVYGKVHMDIRHTDDGNDDNFSVQSNQTRLGFKGAEDLGNGLKAIFKYEMVYGGVDDDNDGTDDASSAVAGARNSYIGLNGGFGTFLVGRHDTPAKMALYAAGNEHLADSIIDFTRIGFTEVRTPNAIAYVSPNWSGFKLAAAIVPGEQTGTTDATDENGLMDSHSLGLMYKNAGLKIGAGYEKIADTSASTTNSDVKTMQVGASYTFMGNYTIGAQYSNDDNFGNVDGAERTTWALAGKVKFGNNAFIANYGNTEEESAASTTTADTDHIGIALHHTMSKRTSAYVAYKSEDPDGGDSTDRIAVGMIHNF